MAERMYDIEFTLPILGMELFVRDPEAPLTSRVPESQLEERKEALRLLDTTEIVSVRLVESQEKHGS